MTRVITIIGFCLEGAFALTLVIWSRVRSATLAGFGELLDRVVASRAARIVLLLFWWWLGWHFLVTPPVAGG